MEAAPEVVQKEMTDDIKNFFEALKSNQSVKPVLTASGRIVLKYLQENPSITVFKAKEIAEGLGSSSRGISGALRKLVTDGFCEKVNAEPVLYSLTEKGKNYNIEGENG